MIYLLLLNIIIVNVISLNSRCVFHYLKDLRKTVFGSAAAPPRGEWTRTPLVFGSCKEVSH